MHLNRAGGNKEKQKSYTIFSPKRGQGKKKMLNDVLSPPTDTIWKMKAQTVFTPCHLQFKIWFWIYSVSSQCVSIWSMSTSFISMGCSQCSWALGLHICSQSITLASNLKLAYKESLYRYRFSLFKLHAQFQTSEFQYIITVNKTETKAPIKIKIKKPVYISILR